MDLGRAFKYVTEDERWLSKLLLTGVIYIVGIPFILLGPIAALGYVVETARNVMQGNPRPLPEWNNFGDKLGKGFGALVVGIVYGIPILVLACVLVGISVALSGTGNSDGAGAAVGVILCLQGIVSLLSLATIPFMLAGLVRYIQTNNIASAIRISDTFATVRRSPGTWIMLLLIYILCQLVGQVGAILCGIGLFLSIPYGLAVFSHVLGQVAAQTGGALGNYGQTPPSYDPPPSYQ